MSVAVNIDLRSQLGKARDQGSRPTCLPFAVSAAHEVHRSATDYLSVEALAWAAAQHSHKDPSQATSVPAVVQGLLQQGQCAESGWPYSETEPIAKMWAPPKVRGPAHRAKLQVEDRNAEDVRVALQNGQPVLLVMAVTVALYTPNSDSVVRPAAIDHVTANYHALLAVGSGTDGDGALLLVRNSWGAGWGNAGHAWLPDFYVDQHLRSTGVISSAKD